MNILSIIIVNFNSKKVLIDCLQSLLRNNEIASEVFVIDNASNESVKDLEYLFPQVIFICNKQNLGFAAANNIGIKKAKGKFILLLNPDTIINNNPFHPMIEYLENHKDVGIVGCKIITPHGEIERSTHSFPTLTKEFVHANEYIKRFLNYNSKIAKTITKIINIKSFDSYWNHDSVKEVDHVTGACMMVKKEAIEKAGLLDEAFFLYTEEVEWSLRIKLAGYKSIFIPYSSIIHLFGYSTKQKVQKQTVNKLLVERYRGMLYFFQKHYSPYKLTALKIIIIQGFALRLFFNLFKSLILLGKEKRKEYLEERKIVLEILNLVRMENFDWRKEYR